MCNSKISKNKKKYLDDDPDTLITEDTCNQIMDSIKVLNYICDNFNKYKNTYLLIRPPGHHSHDNHHEGFCIINNAYLLARNLIDKEKARKVLIFDWDLHHGNGTEKLIKENTKNDIYFVSIHGYGLDFYPRTGTGISPNILNIPMEKGSSHLDYINLFESVAVPFINNISDIDCIIISNGLDGHKDDKFNFLELIDETYVHMTNYFLGLNKQMVFLLEGGYNPNVISNISHKLLNLFM